MTLEQFMTSKLAGGKKVIPALTKHFKVTEACLYHWRRGVSLPRAPQMVQIVQMSGGKVTYKEMIETFVANSRKKPAKKKAVAAPPTKKKKVFAPNQF
jgi:hypothetical protein